MFGGVNQGDLDGIPLWYRGGVAKELRTAAKGKLSRTLGRDGEEIGHSVYAAVFRIWVDIESYLILCCDEMKYRYSNGV
jgi:hypothetical protein